MMKNFYGVHDSAVALQPCPSGHLTHRYVARYAKSKLSSANSFIRKTLGEIP